MKRYYYIITLIFLLVPLYVNGLDYPKTSAKIIEIYDLEDNKILY